MGWLRDKAKSVAKTAANEALHKVADAAGAGPRTDSRHGHYDCCNGERKKGHLNGCDGRVGSGSRHSGETEMTKQEYAKAVKDGQKFKSFRVQGNKVYVQYN